MKSACPKINKSKLKSSKGEVITLCLVLSDTVVLQSTVHAFCSPCILNASTGKQSTVALLISIYTPVAADERSKRMWRPNVFTNSCQLKAFWYNQTLLETAS